MNVIHLRCVPHRFSINFTGIFKRRAWACRGPAGRRRHAVKGEVNKLEVARLHQEPNQPLGLDPRPLGGPQTGPRRLLTARRRPVTRTNDSQSVAVYARGPLLANYIHVKTMDKCVPLCQWVLIAPEDTSDLSDYRNEGSRRGC